MSFIRRQDRDILPNVKDVIIHCEETEVIKVECFAIQHCVMGVGMGLCHQSSHRFHMTGPMAGGRGAGVPMHLLSVQEYLSSSTQLASRKPSWTPQGVSPLCFHN